MRRLFLLFFVCCVSIAKAEITLPSIFSSNMVLQRESTVDLFGWAHPGEEFTITTGWDSKVRSIKTPIKGKWRISVETPGAGGPYEIAFKGASNEILLDNILIGEVWLCSGQSNMEWSANSGLDNKEEAISSSDKPTIRLFTVEKRTADHPQDNLAGTWQVCSPETMPEFSAVAYFFAERLQEEMDVPIGLIDSSWGASCAEVWTPEEEFDKYPALQESYGLIKPNPWVPIEKSILYNAMIAPLTNFKISGTLWYQGESNTANAESYENTFGTLIQSWRNKWGYEFPFYFVQIAPYKYGREYEGGIVRDQQRRTLSLPNTGMAMTSDICTVDDIHPRNKKDVGIRLANIALKQQYDVLDTTVYGPLFDKAEAIGDKVMVHFLHNEGLTVKGKDLEHFEVLSSDGTWYPAKAKIKNGIVTVQAKEAKEPKMVRYAYRSTDVPNLFNSVGLPASTFISEEL
ncbi:sialate O-acetylesterase [Maribacter aurantiacus]|uniref:Sialate O-acetylesterase n=1 Tax=Maribacter aurantiacus TaxID=1882343 RepID=A0A5R8M4E1_9FLAO|nr:sialate O-acetylesterase [Maribacter aurantiacus]TLF44443.1 sialate O-acetylesterase [Maribacter aurantiacus]